MSSIKLMKDIVYGFDSKDLILRDYLAIDRTILANERTFLSWIRTALNLIITGLSFVKLLDSKIAGNMGYVLIMAGLVAIVTGIIKYFRWKRHLANMK